MENNITKFDEAIKQRVEDSDTEMVQVELTDTDREEVNEMIRESQEEPIIMIKETTGDSVKEQSLNEYIKPLDDAIPTMKSDGTKLVSMTQPQELQEYVSSVRNYSTEQLKNLASKKMTDAEFRDLVNTTLAGIRKELKVDKLYHGTTVARLSRMKPMEVFNMVPRALIDSFIPADVMKADRGAAKDALVDIIGYMILNGPESDDFETYMENQSKLFNVMQALNETNFKVKDLIQSKETVAQLAQQALKNSDPRTMAYMKYVQSPDNINLIFTQHSAVNMEFAKAYRELRENYSDPAELAIIDHEIEDAETKAELYHSVLNLDTFRTVFDIFRAEFLKDKRCSIQSLEKVAKSNLDRIRRAHIEAPFPGYLGSESSTNEIYVHYRDHFRKHGEKYNEFVTKSNATEKPPLELIENIDVFANTVLVVMGRLQKRLLKEPSTLHDKIEDVVYFEMFCRLCTDIFTTAKVVELVNPFVTELVRRVK